MRTKLSRCCSSDSRKTGNLRIMANGASQIMVWACPQDQLDIAKIITNSQPPPDAVEAITLTVLDPTRLAETIKGAFGKNDSLFIEADASRGVIIVKGTAEQVKSVKQFIQAVGENPSQQSGNMRIFSMEKGGASARTMAEALERMLRELRPNNPVKTVFPGDFGEKKKPEPAPKIPPPSDPNDFQSKMYKRLGSSYVATAQDKLPQGKGERPPVLITAFGNKLIVSSDDREALVLIEQYIRLLRETQADAADFVVIPLTYLNAVEAASVLDEVFNGPRPTGQMGGGPGNRGGGRGPGGPGGGGPGGINIPGLPGGLGALAQLGNLAGGGTPRVERIRVVADTATNKLLVKASPLDMLTLRNLLSKLDVGDVENAVRITTKVIGPLKYAQATDVASVIEKVYRESMNNNGRAGVVNTTPFGAFAAFGRGNAPNQNVDANGNPKGVTLTIAVDDRTNSLVIACPETMHEDIAKVVKSLEDNAKDTTKVVQIVSVKGVDPYLLQQAIDAMQGKRTSVPATGGNFGGGFGNPGFGGGGNRGGNPMGPFGMPGGGFQGGPGGGFPGGGFNGGGVGARRGPGTGGGGPPGGGGGRPTGAGGGGRGATRGPGFFESRVMDDPQEAVLFDPRSHIECHFQYLTELEQSLAPVAWISDREDSSFVQAAVQPPPGPGLPFGPGVRLPGSEGTFVVPRLPVTADSLPSLDMVIVRADNPADLQAALMILDYIQKKGAEAEVVIQMVPLRFGDATSVTGHLNQMFSRVIVGPNSNAQIIQVRPGQGGGFPGQGGGFPGQGGQGQGFPGQGQGFPGQGGQGQGNQQSAQAASVVLIPIPRQNAILLAAPRSCAYPRC